MDARLNIQNPIEYLQVQPLQLVQLELARFTLYPIEKYKHSLMSSFSSLLALFCAHHIFELEQFIVKMRNTIVRIALFEQGSLLGC